MPFYFLIFLRIIFPAVETDQEKYEFKGRFLGHDAQSVLSPDIVYVTGIDIILFCSLLATIKVQTFIEVISLIFRDLNFSKLFVNFFPIYCVLVFSNYFLNLFVCIF